ncbi:hypothetical protein F6Y01_11080 [Escherichia coli]|nr:hypothetical protein F6Y01_11080 [Escherichia coli]
MSSSQELRSDFYREEILMETVFDALKAMGKATSVELAWLSALCQRRMLIAPICINPWGTVHNFIDIVNKFFNWGEPSPQTVNQSELKLFRLFYFYTLF